MTAAISVKDLNFRYSPDAELTLKDITFELPQGEIMAIMGPNGSGKSTLLKNIMGLLRPESGTIKVFGVSVLEEPVKAQRMIGYVPQKDNISSHLPIRVKDVVLMGRMARKGAMKISTAKDAGVAKKALEYVNMLDHWNTRFSSLSGGQQQRVLIARALAVEPKLLLFDEPFSAMDVPTQKETTEVIAQLVEEHGLTVAMVIHDINPVLHIIDKVLLLNHRMMGFGDPLDILNAELLKETYGAIINIITCEEGYCHPIIGDHHA